MAKVGEAGIIDWDVLGDVVEVGEDLINLIELNSLVDLGGPDKSARVHGLELISERRVRSALRMVVMRIYQNEK